SGDDTFSEAPEDFRLLAPDGRYVVGIDPPPRPATVGVKVADGGTLVYLSGRSRTGTCFYVMAQVDGPVGYAHDDQCRAADVQDYTEEW
ncbi:MAG: hypothetical protein ABIW46_00825, partial [Acidimicrobiales bacterium]